MVHSMSGDTAYLMSYHMNGSTWLDSDGLHLAYSYDAKRWTPLRNGPASCGTFGGSLSPCRCCGAPRRGAARRAAQPPSSGPARSGTRVNAARSKTT